MPDLFDQYQTIQTDTDASFSTTSTSYVDMDTSLTLDKKHTGLAFISHVGTGFISGSVTAMYTNLLAGGVSVDAGVSHNPGSMRNPFQRSAVVPLDGKLVKPQARVAGGTGIYSDTRLEIIELS